jgi:hypothetical protein
VKKNLNIDGLTTRIASAPPTSVHETPAGLPRRIRAGPLADGNEVMT